MKFDLRMSLRHKRCWRNFVCLFLLERRQVAISDEITFISTIWKKYRSLKGWCAKGRNCLPVAHFRTLFHSTISIYSREKMSITCHLVFELHTESNGINGAKTIFVVVFVYDERQWDDGKNNIIPFGCASVRIFDSCVLCWLGMKNSAISAIWCWHMKWFSCLQQ